MMTLIQVEMIPTISISIAHFIQAASAAAATFGSFVAKTSVIVW